MMAEQSEGLTQTQDFLTRPETALNAEARLQKARGRMYNSLEGFIATDQIMLRQKPFVVVKDIYAARFFETGPNDSRVAVVVGNTLDSYNDTENVPGNTIASIIRKGGNHYPEDPTYQKVIVDPNDSSKILVKDATFQEFQELLQQRIKEQIIKADEINTDAEALHKLKRADEITDQALILNSEE